MLFPSFDTTWPLSTLLSVEWKNYLWSQQPSKEQKYPLSRKLQTETVSALTSTPWTRIQTDQPINTPYWLLIDYVLWLIKLHTQNYEERKTRYRSKIGRWIHLWFSRRFTISRSNPKSITQASKNHSWNICPSPPQICSHRTNTCILEKILHCIFWKISVEFIENSIQICKTAKKTTTFHKKLPYSNIQKPLGSFQQRVYRFN